MDFLFQISQRNKNFICWSSVQNWVNFIKKNDVSQIDHDKQIAAMPYILHFETQK